MFSYAGYGNLQNDSFKRPTVEGRTEVLAGRKAQGWWIKDMGVQSRQPKTGLNIVERVKMKIREMRCPPLSLDVKK